MSTPIPPGAPGMDTVRVPAPDLQAEARRLAELVRRDFSDTVAPGRIDSELSPFSRITEHEHKGVDVVVGPVLAQILAASLRAARLTGGLIDPTTGGAAWRVQDGLPARPAPGIGHLDRRSRRLRMLRGTVVDLEAVSDAWAAERTVQVLTSAGSRPAGPTPRPLGVHEK